MANIDIRAVELRDTIEHLQIATSNSSALVESFMSGQYDQYRDLAIKEFVELLVLLPAEREALSAAGEDVDELEPEEVMSTVHEALEIISSSFGISMTDADRLVKQHLNELPVEEMRESRIHYRTAKIH